MGLLTGTPSLVSDAIPSTMVGPVDSNVSASGTLVYAVDDATESCELVWVGRNGQSEPVDATWNAAFGSPTLSTDGANIAVALQHENTSDIWIKRVSGGPAVKLSIGSQKHDDRHGPQMEGRSVSSRARQGPVPLATSGFAPSPEGRVRRWS